MLCRYVISESLELRQEIKQQHEIGRSIITDMSTVIQHTNCHQFGSTECKGSVAHNLRMAAGQLWVFSATDVQVTALLLVAWSPMQSLHRSIYRFPLPLHVRRQHRLQLGPSHSFPFPAVSIAKHG